MSRTNQAISDKVAPLKEPTTLRVLHVLNEIRFSGAETMLCSAAKVWADVDLHVLSTGASVGDFAPQLAAAGFDIHHLPFKKSLNFAASFRQFVRDLRPDIVHLHTERAFPIYAVLLSTIRRRPVVIRTIHHIFRFRGVLRIRKLVERRLAQTLGIHQFCNSESGRRAEWETYGLLRTVIPNWYDSTVFGLGQSSGRKALRHQLGLPQASKIIVSVGSNSSYKNLESVVDALPLVRKQCEAIYLHVGDEGAEAPLTRYAAARRLGDYFRATGSVPSVCEYLWAADVFVMPSREEGFGIAAVEAMACGLPVVLSRCDGLRDFAEYEPTIIYVDVDPLSLASGILNVLEWTDEQRAAVGESQAATVRRMFGLQAGPGEYLKVYRLLVGRRQH